MSKIEVEFFGKGYEIGCYVVDDEILDQLLNASKEDALYEDNPISLVRDIGKNFTLIANGFDLLSDTFECKVTVDGNETNIQKFGFYYKDEPFEECFDTPREETLIADEEKSEVLGEQFSLSKGESLIVEVIDMKGATLSTAFETTNDASVSDLEIIVMDLDVPTDLSRATYDQGLLQAMDFDIRAISCFDQRYDLELDIINSYPSSFYLVKRNEQGEWEFEYLA